MGDQQASLSAYYIPRKHGVLTKQVAGEMVIIDIEHGIYHGLNSLGVYIWEQLDGQHTLGQIADELVEHYHDVGKAVIEADILLLVQDLLDNELVESC